MSAEAGVARQRAPLVTRRRLQVALGLLWIFDGVLQAQPQMFTPEFFGMMLRMGQDEPPSWLWDLGSRIEPFTTTHAALADVLCVAVQLAIGLGLLFRRSAKPALAVSIGWALVVWLFGEAAGGLFGPDPAALSGAPGAALLYGALALLLWPRRPDEAASVAESGPWRYLPELCWLALWLGTAVLEAKALNDEPLVAGGIIYNAAIGEPGWMAAINHAFGTLVGAHGSLFALCSGLAQGAIGLLVLHRATRRAALVAGIALALFYGLVGQDFGGVFSGGVFGSDATDPGTGPVVVLIALALWPRSSPLLDPAAAPRPASALGARVAAPLRRFRLVGRHPAHARVWSSR